MTATLNFYPSDLWSFSSLSIPLVLIVFHWIVRLYFVRLNYIRPSSLNSGWKVLILYESKILFINYTYICVDHHLSISDRNPLYTAENTSIVAAFDFFPVVMVILFGVRLVCLTFFNQAKHARFANRWLNVSTRFDNVFPVVKRETNKEL